MSLLRLLTAGKCLVTSGGVLRYREAGPAALPKFGSGKHPFGGNGPVMPPASAQTPEEVASAAEASGPKLSGAAPLKPTASSASWWPRWLGSWRRPKRAPIPRFNNPLVQAELSLDRVKVLRNDLSDSDLEVVPVRAPVEQAARAGSQEKPGKQPKPEIQPQRSGESLVR